MSITRLKENITEDLLTCAICTEEYDSGEHRPLLLPCRHILCASCVQSLVQGTYINCPVDRRPFHVPRNGLQGFAVDKTTQDVQNFIRRSSTLTIHMIKDKLLKCLKCRSDYDEAEHVPLSLPCQHPLCFSCVEGGSVQCPIDGRRCMVPQSGFPKDNTLRQLKDILQQGYLRPASSRSTRTNRLTGSRQRQSATQIRRNSWADNIRDFDLEESTNQVDLSHDIRPRRNYIVHVHRQPEYAQRGSPQPVHFPFIPNNLRQVNHNMTFDMGNVMRNIDRGVRAALRGAKIAVQEVQRMAQNRD